MQCFWKTQPLVFYSIYVCMLWFEVKKERLSHLWPEYSRIMYYIPKDYWKQVGLRTHACYATFTAYCISGYMVLCALYEYVCKCMHSYIFPSYSRCIYKPQMSVVLSGACFGRICIWQHQCGPISKEQRFRAVTA